MLLGTQVKRNSSKETVPEPRNLDSLLFTGAQCLSNLYIDLSSQTLEIISEGSQKPQREDRVAYYFRKMGTGCI